MKQLVETQMRSNDETTAVQLHALLTSKGYAMSLSTVLRCRRALGWAFRGSTYCQMIHEANRAKRLQWATAYRHKVETGFQGNMFTDEMSVQLESHCRFCCRKRKEHPKPEPRYTPTYCSYTTCTSNQHVYEHVQLYICTV